jgi:hypothetical protein
MADVSIHINNVVSPSGDFVQYRLLRQAFSCFNTAFSSEVVCTTSVLTPFCLALTVESNRLLGRILRTKAFGANIISGLRIKYYYAFKPDVVSILEVVRRII